MSFQRPLQRLAMKLHLVGSTPAPLEETPMAMAACLHGGVALVACGLLLFEGVIVPLALGVGLVSFLVLTLGLYHRTARWMSIALGSAFAVALGVGTGMVVGRTLHAVIGGTIGAVISALTYRRLVVESVRRLRSR